MDDLTRELEFETAEARKEGNSEPIILLGADHAGFELKENIKEWLWSLGYKVEDQGAFALNKDDDYPAVCRMVGKQVGSGDEKYKGLLFGGTGQGEAMSANRSAHVRAVVYYGGNEEIIKLSREHNDANVLSLGARFMIADEAKKVIKLWLDTPFSGEERHERRIKKIDGELKEENVF